MEKYTLAQSIAPATKKDVPRRGYILFAYIELKLIIQPSK